MLTQNNISLFDIQELVLMIVNYLSMYEFKRFMVANKSLYQMLTPLLWKHVTLDFRPKKDLLLRNRQYIQTLSIEECHDYIFSILALPQQPMEPDDRIHSITPLTADIMKPPIAAMNNLQKLVISGYYRPMFPDFITALSHIPRLVRLHLPVRLLSSDISKRSDNDFIDLLSQGLPQLRELSTKGTFIETTAVVLLLLAGLKIPELEVLKCDSAFYHLDNIDEFILSLPDVKMKLESDGVVGLGSKIKTMMLPRSIYKANILLRFLKDYCPNVERFDLPDIEFESTSQKKDIFTGAWCPYLQHITCKAATRHDLDTICSFLSGCSQRIGLKTFIVDCGSDISDIDKMISTLLSCHSETLEDITIKYHMELDGEAINGILTTCRNLKRLRIVPSYHSNSIRFKTLVPGEWVCLDLKELYLFVSFESEIQNNDEHDNKKPLSIAKMFFSQIHRLTKLETFAFGWQSDVTKQDILASERNDCRGFSSVDKTGNGGLPLNQPWLMELANLCNLRHFHMLSHVWHYVNEAEIILVLNNWPRLRKVSFDQGDRICRNISDRIWMEQRLDIEIDFPKREP